MSEHQYVYMGSTTTGINGTCSCGAALYDGSTYTTYAIMLANHIKDVITRTEPE